jgi:hypothetical protein
MKKCKIFSERLPKITVTTDIARMARSVLSYSIFRPALIKGKPVASELVHMQEFVN